MSGLPGLPGGWSREVLVKHRFLVDVVVFPFHTVQLKFTLFLLEFFAGNGASDFGQRCHVFGLFDFYVGRIKDAPVLWRSGCRGI